MLHLVGRAHGRRYKPKETQAAFFFSIPRTCTALLFLPFWDRSHSVGMMARAEMEDVLCWKMLRAAINPSFDLETLPGMVKTAGSANQMARTLSAPNFSLLVFQFPLTSVRFCSLQNLDLPKTNIGRQQNTERCTVLTVQKHHSQSSLSSATSQEDSKITAD